MRRRIWCAGLSVLFAAELLAAPRPPGRERPEVVEAWKASLARADEALRNRDWRSARRTLDRVLPEMCSRIESGEGSAPLLALAALLRGLAYVGLRDFDRGRWDHGIAVALHGELIRADLSAYAEAGEYLTDWRSGELNGPDFFPLLVAGDVVPPKKLKGDAPRYPYAKMRACAEGPVVVQAILDKDGILRSPSLVGQYDPVLAFAALDALRTWRFRPASVEGKPVPAYYNLSVNFDVTVCADR